MLKSAWIYAPILAFLAPLAGCRPHIPSGLYACEADSDCPRALVCSEVSRSCISASERELEAAAIGADNGEGGSDASGPDLGGAGGSYEGNVSGRPGKAGSAAPGAGVGGAAAAGSSAGRGTAGDAAAGSGVAGMTAGDTCTTDGVSRCSTGFTRQTCRRGLWAADDCPSGQVCSSAGGAVACVAAASICRGSEGKAVCGDKGELTVCNPDGTIDTKSSMTCKSTRHCQAGLASKTCAVCLANEEHHCEGGALQVCAADGRSFQTQKDCPTAALCNEAAGECLTGVCSPNKKTCDTNKLLTCNADGTAYVSMTDCGSGTCDAAGGDCNKCDPGRKTCDAAGRAVLTCRADGQADDMTPCPGTQRCAGAGLCVDCLDNGDCAAGTKCERSQCVCAPQCTGKTCGSDGCGGSCGLCLFGTSCVNDQCVCAPQCSGKECGSDGCGGSCGACTGNDTCNSSGQCACTKQCSGKECGSDGCGGSCGSCGSGTACNAGGQCVANCGNGAVDPGETCDDGNASDADACVGCQKAFCGDGHVQTGIEECDLQAADWKQKCDLNCARTLYTPCRSGDSVDCSSESVCSVIAATNQGICTPMCNHDSDCPSLPDASGSAYVALCNFGRCMLRCHGSACPLHMSCSPNVTVIADPTTGATTMADVCITAPP